MSRVLISNIGTSTRIYTLNVIYQTSRQIPVFSNMLQLARDKNEIAYRFRFSLLCRRLFAWLLGSDITSNSTSPNKDLSEQAKQSSDSKKMETVDQYFKTYSKDLLISVS